VFTEADALGARWQRPVRVFEHDRGLVAGLDAETRQGALHHGVADSLVLEQGAGRRCSDRRSAPIRSGCSCSTGC